MIQCIHNMTRLFCIHLFTCIVINNSGLPPIETVETILAFLSCCLGESCVLGVSQPKKLLQTYDGWKYFCPVWFCFVGFLPPKFKFSMLGM